MVPDFSAIHVFFFFQTWGNSIHNFNIHSCPTIVDTLKRAHLTGSSVNNFFKSAVPLGELQPCLYHTERSVPRKVYTNVAAERFAEIKTSFTLININKFIYEYLISNVDVYQRCACIQLHIP